MLTAFKEVETAKQSADTAVNNANKYRSEKIPAAEAQADQILQNAQAQKEARINEAAGQVARFNSMYQEYARYPLITKQRMYYETMEEVLPGLRVIIQDGNGNTLNILGEAGSAAGPAGRGGESMKRSKKIGVTLAAVLVLIVMALGSACVVTQQNEYTVVRQFGEVVDIRGTAGVSLKIPLIQTASTLPNTVLLYDLPISDVITQDKKTMVADSFVLWKIEDPKLFIQTLNGSISNAEPPFHHRLQQHEEHHQLAHPERRHQRPGRRTGRGHPRRVGDTLSQYGIQLIAVETKHLDLPDDNKEAVYQRMISERNNIAASYTAQGESDAQKIRSETDREVQVMLSEAEAQAEMLIAEGEAEYMNILSDAYSDPAKADFYSFVRALDAAKASLSGAGTPCSSQRIRRWRRSFTAGSKPQGGPPPENRGALRCRSGGFGRSGLAH